MSKGETELRDTHESTWTSFRLWRFIPEVKEIPPYILESLLSCKSIQSILFANGVRYGG